MPIERTITDYYAVETQVEYIPKEIEETIVEYEPVERVWERVQYLPVETQIVHYPERDNYVAQQGQFIQKYVDGGSQVRREENVTYTSGVQGGTTYTTGGYATGIQGANTYTTGGYATGSNVKYTGGSLIGGNVQYTGGYTTGGYTTGGYNSGSRVGEQTVTYTTTQQPVQYQYSTTQYTQPVTYQSGSRVGETVTYTTGGQQYGSGSRVGETVTYTTGPAQYTTYGNEGTSGYQQIYDQYKNISQWELCLHNFIYD